MDLIRVLSLGIGLHALILIVVLVVAWNLKGPKLRVLRHRLGDAFLVILFLFPINALGSAYLENLKVKELGFDTPKDYYSAAEHGIKDVGAWQVKKAQLTAEADEVNRQRALADLQRNATRQQREEERAQQCRADPQCYIEPTWRDAQSACAEAVERTVTFGIRWESGFFEDKFSSTEWWYMEQGVVVLTGEKVRLENQYGAWGKGHYWCNYDVPNAKVIGAGAQIGS
jgi:hypothetical protein